MGILEDAQMADQMWRADVSRRLDEHFEAIERHAELLAEGDRRMRALADAIDENTVITKRIDDSTSTIVKGFKAIEGFSTVTGWLGKAVLVTGAIILALGVIYWYFKTGELPRKGS